MAIKDLFSKQKSQSVEFRGASKKSVDEFRQDVESGEEIKQIRIEDSLVIPDLNYASASSFVKYGSAKKYYEDAIKRIYSQYPYDGSSAEKTAFKNEITQLERYILDNQYPKSTGFAVFSPDGWGTSDGTNSNGFYSSSLPEHIAAFGWKKDQVWDTASSQQQSFRLDFTEGFTVEFWLKKGDFGVSSGSEAIFDIRDTVNASASFGAYMSGSSGGKTSKLYSYYNNASANFTLTLTTGLGTSDSDWHHYAIVYGYTGTTYTANLYVDGEFANNTTAASTNVAQTGSLKLTVGALGGDFFNTASATPAGYGKLSGSLDEFRFWQESRDAQEIGRNYFTAVNGGGNTDTSKVNDSSPLKLSCYFKFNEGKTGTSTTDAVVLDYSGRLANGSWTGYVSNSRDTGSAITQAGVGTETGDLIIYSTHPDVVTLSNNLEASGTQYDAENIGSLQDSVPLWMLDEDRQQGAELQNLLQVLGSYLDSLYLQVTQMTKFHEAEYQDNNTVAANPHNRRLLTSLGFDVPELFIDNDVLKTIANQDDKRKFEDKLNEIKNLIYKNIYNNLNYINKSKGTVKSIRNLLRCYGIDDDLFNFNVYADKAQYAIKDDYKNSSIKFDSLDLTPFASTQNTEGVIYNFAESGNANSAPYISGSSDDLQLGFTVEANVIFPKTPPNYTDPANITSPAIVTSSVFGLREAQFTNSTTVPSPDDANISVRVVKDDNTAKFQVSSSIGSGIFLESDKFYDVYENSRWNLSVRVKYDAEPFSIYTGSAGYKLEFYGYNYIQDVLQNSFTLTSNLSNANGQSFVSTDKRVYAGAERENITGSLTRRANMKLLSVLAWQDYLEDTEIKSHARDVTSFGRDRPYKNSFTYRSSSFDDMFVPKFDTLAMNLAFNQVTSSDSSGEFVVPDLSSGSINLVDEYVASGDNYSKLVNIQHTAEGKGFPASSDVKDIQYLNVVTQQIPENLNTDNMIEILERDDDKFFIDNRPVKYFFSLEASMYDTISREMLKTFAGVLDYASMVGSPVTNYQVFNKEMRLARHNFFERVENNPDLEKYVSLYKFLDSAIESVLSNLMPASANASDRVRTVIESHLFERSTTNRQLPPGKKTDPQNKVGNREILGYNPGVANPIGPYESYYEDDATALKPDEVTGEDFVESFKKLEAHMQGGTFGIETKREDYQKFKGSKNPVSERNIETHLNRYDNKRDDGAIDTDGQNAFYKIRAKRNRTDLDVYSSDAVLKTRTSIHSAYQRDRHIDVTRGAKLKGNVLSNTIGPDDAATRKGNVILPIIQTEQAKNTIKLTRSETPNISNDITKNFVTYDVDITNSTSDVEDIQIVQNNLPVKFTEQVAGREFFLGGDGSIINGHHTDIFYDTQNPLQGPFAEQHVGGYKHRHLEIAETQDRPELFKVSVLSGEETVLHNPRTNETTTTYDFNIPRVKFSRGLGLKKVYNIENIATTTGSKTLGNFDKNYQVVMTNGRRQNNFAFVQQSGFNITEAESTAVSGVIDFALPTRSLSDGTFNKTVIVNRFSSPGEVATLSEGYLDIEAAELSPYNALPFRNRQVVNNLNDFMAKPSAFGGYQSGSVITASYHKVQRNRVNRIKQNLDGTTYTGSFEDSGFFNYQIPKKDFGYWWISSSAVPELSTDGLYGFAANSIDTSSYGITFLSGAIRDFESSEQYIINFVGVSTPGEFSQFAGYHYEIDEDQNLLKTPLNYVTTPSLADNVDVYFLNINGPYGYPSFKQTRTANHPVARYLRKNNYFILPGLDGYEDIKIQHSPVSTKTKPIIHLLKSKEILGAKEVEKDLLMTYPFASEFNYYGNFYDTNSQRIRNILTDKSFKNTDKTDSLLYNISSLYTGRTTVERVKTVKLTSLFFSETVYPKETNTYLSKARDRSRFLFNWRDSIANRADNLTGSQGTGLFSYWSMDKSSTVVGELMDETSGSQSSTTSPRYGRYRLEGSSGYVNLSSSTPSNTVQSTAGDGPFEDSYTEWNSDIRTIAKDHSIVPEYKISDNVEAIINSGYDIANDTYQSLSLTGSISTENNNVFLETFAHSDDIPAIEIVRELQERDAKRISIKISAAKKLLPYDGFYPVQRTLQLSTLFSSSVEPGTTTTGADASFQTLNNTIFSRLTYGSIRAGIATDTAIWTSGDLVVGGTAASATALFTFNGTGDPEGLRIALQSSQGTEFYVFADSHAGGKDGSVSNPFIIVSSTSDAATLASNTQNAIAASGTIGITANRFSGAVGLTASFDAGAAGNNNVFYAEDSGGVLGGKINNTGFNAGTVDVEGVTMHQLDFSGGTSAVAGFNATASFSRLPFETIIDPSSYLNSSSIIENDPENSFNSTASIGFVNQAYSLAASNFYAGVVDTFIENKTLSTIKTKPQSEWSFSDGSLNTYTMDVVVKKESNFSNHDDPAANGAPYTAHACFYQSLKLGSEEYWAAHITHGSSSVDARIPPAASWESNEAIATIDFDYNAFKSAISDREIPTFGDILRFSTKTFKNQQIFEQLGATQGTSTNTNQSQFMTVEAGVDLFNYDDKTGQWIINTKCEFPVHNVAPGGTGVAASFPDGTDGGTGQNAGDVNRGVWHQYLTNTKSGLKLEVRGPDTTSNRTSGSLAQACGFETDSKVISEMATSTQLREYLVAIPFVVNECEEESFFHYTTREFEEAYKNIGTETRSSLTKMLELQRQMILPPKLNYMAKRDASDRVLNESDYGPILPPFAMYAFEITEDLNQEDLSKWWQGVLPSAGTKVSMETFNINHEIKAGEIISPSVLNNDIFGGKLPKEMRFKIFKVKYRRNLTYNEVKNRSIYGTEPVNSFFGYNYPHDFYSLIEMAKVDLGLEYEGDEE